MGSADSDHPWKEGVVTGREKKSLEWDVGTSNVLFLDLESGYMSKEVQVAGYLQYV